MQVNQQKTALNENTLFCNWITLEISTNLLYDLKLVPVLGSIASNPIKLNAQSLPYKLIINRWNKLVNTKHDTIILIWVPQTNSLTLRSWLKYFGPSKCNNLYTSNAVWRMHCCWMVNQWRVFLMHNPEVNNKTRSINSPTYYLHKSIH